MARLELHGPGGTLVSVELPRMGNLLVGSDAVCDIQIHDPDVQPIHARLKIQPGTLQIEATPEGKSFRHNGKRVAVCQVAPGDELVLESIEPIFLPAILLPQSLLHRLLHGHRIRLQLNH